MVEHFVFRQCLAFHQHHASKGTLRPLGVWHANNGCLFNFWMRHQLVFNFNRRDPFATRLDEILRAVYKPNATLRIHRCHVARSKPTILGETFTGPGVVVIRRRNPVATALQLATGFAVPCNRRGGAWLDNSRIDTKSNLTNSGSQLGLLRLWQQPICRRQRANGSDWAGFGHTPSLQNGQAGLLAISLAQCFWHRRASTRNCSQRRSVSAL